MAMKAILIGILLIALGAGAIYATRGPDPVNATAKALDNGGDLGDAIAKDAKAVGDHLSSGLDRVGETLRTGESAPPERRFKPTAGIPAVFGVLLVVCGVLAFKESRRKHAMHAAAMVGLIGCAVPLYMVVKELVRVISDDDSLRRPAAFYSQLAMAILCGLFVILCVKSFIAARRARQNENA